MAGRAESNCRDSFNPFLHLTNAWMHNNLDREHNGEAGPDFFIATSGIQIEVKNTERNGALVDDTTPTQFRLLEKFGGYIYLVMWDEGYPRLPNGADAYLIPWPEYRDWRPTVPNMKSIRRHKTSRGIGVDEVFPQWKLKWRVVTGGRSHFEVPYNHPIWNDIKQRVADFSNKLEIYLNAF